MSSGFGSIYNSVTSAVGGAIDATGKAISSAGKAVQQGVDSAGSWIDDKTDHLVDSFEHSSVGNNVVGQSLGENVKDSVHFGTGVASGATTLVSGAAKLVGGGLQYASNSQFRSETNQTMSYVAHNPGKVASAAWKQGVDAFKADPNHAAGEVGGMIAGTLLTGGLGTAGKAAEGGEVVEEAAEGLSKAGEVGEAAANASNATGRVLSSGQDIANAGKDWETTVQNATGGQSQIINGREYDSVTDNEIIQAKDSTAATNNPHNFLNKSVRNQIKQTVKTANEQNKTPVFWFKDQPHPDVTSYIQEHGGTVRWGAPQEPAIPATTATSGAARKTAAAVGATGSITQNVGNTLQQDQ